MIPELGHFALILAFCVTLVQSVLPMIGASRRDRAIMDMARPAAIAQFLLIALAFGALIISYVMSDFSVLNVAENSHTSKPLLYKITGVWGNHEGSMLLWVFILAFYGMTVATFGRELPPLLRARTLSVQGMISCGFLAFILFTSNPFLRLNPAPLDGNGLNPILQDPGLAFHPPCLYLGYVGFSIVFSFAIAGLIEGRVDAAWARHVRPWALLAWSFLTLGIAMGSWWAYYTLGWGGWWYWDPVENASFMPWLAGTAFVHSLMVTEKRGSLKSWTVLLAIIAFSLSLLGTFLVRSGTLTSVHSFASDPARGVFILLLLTLAIGGSLIMYAVRAPSLINEDVFAPISREGALLINNLFLCTAAGTVLLGTLYPLIMDALDLGKISVGPPFFNIVFIPLMVPTIAVMAIGPMLQSKRGDLPVALGRLKLAFFAALAAALMTWLATGEATGPLWAAGGIGLATWLFAGTLLHLNERIFLFRIAFTDSLRRARNLPRPVYGMTLAHCGMAVLIIGITGSTAWKTEKIQTMHVNDTVDVAGYALTLKNVDDNVHGPNYIARRATFEATRRGKHVATMRPEKRLYDMPPLPTTDAAIHTNFLGDLYVVIGDDDGKGGYVTRLYYNPLVPWIFIGGVMMAAGGMLSLSGRR